MSDNLSNHELCARVRRYLPYLGAYASDVRAIVESLEALQIELAQAVEHNAALIDLAKTATRDAIAEATAGNDIQTAQAFANFETMEREELLAFCRWNDANGEYSDEWSAEELRAVIRLWKEEEEG